MDQRNGQTEVRTGWERINENVGVRGKEAGYGKVLGPTYGCRGTNRQYGRKIRTGITDWQYGGAIRMGNTEGQYGGAQVKDELTGRTGKAMDEWTQICALNGDYGIMNKSLF